MRSPDVFCAVPTSVFPIDRNQCLIVNKRDGSVHQLDVLAARALACCQGVRPLEAHAAAMLQAGVTANPEALAKAVERLLAVGLLRPWTFHRPLGLTPEPPGEIDTVAISTADRPAMLARCLDSVIRQCRQWGHAPRLLVVDGARRESAATVDVVCAAATHAPGQVEYIGQEQAAQIRHDLAVEGIPQDVLNFALTPGEIGANRNLVLLSTRGERVLMVDDDIVLEPWALDKVEDGVAFVGHDDPGEWRFFESRRAALDAAHRVNVDLLAAHSAMLGRRLADVLANTVADLSSACQHMIGAAEEPGERTVRVTFTGLAGDSARYCAHRLLFANGPIRNALLGHADALQLALSSREVQRVTRRLAISHDSSCMSYCMGLDNRSLLPPFLPVGRNEDGVFGVTLGLTDENALFAHLPYGVIHDSQRPSSYAEDEKMVSARRTRLSDLILWLTQRSMHLLDLAGHGAVTLRQLGDGLANVQTMASDRQMSLFAEASLGVRCQGLAGADAVGLQPGPIVASYAASVADYRRAVVAFEDAGLAVGAAGLTQAVTAFARLMIAWNDVQRANTSNKCAMAEA